MIKPIHEYINTLISAKRYDICNENSIIRVNSKFDVNIFNTPMDFENKLILAAKNNRFDTNQYKDWLEDEQKDSKLLQFMKYKLGYCLRDDGGNYICYSFFTKKFYEFNHETFELSDMNKGMDIN